MLQKQEYLGILLKWFPSPLNKATIHYSGVDGLKTEGIRGKNEISNLGKFSFSFSLSVFGFVLFFPCQGQKGSEFWSTTPKTRGSGKATQRLKAVILSLV